MSTALASASARMARSRGSVRCQRVGSGGYAGTAMSPACRQAQNASTNSRPPEHSIRTREPAGSTARSDEAMTRTRCRSPAKVRSSTTPWTSPVTKNW
jgi:hypothetical protein